MCPEPGVDPVVGKGEHQERDDDRRQGGVEHLGTELVMVGAESPSVVHLDSQLVRGLSWESVVLLETSTVMGLN